MKKRNNKIFKPIGRFFKVFFRVIYKILDILIVTPLSKIVYRVGDAIANRNGSFDNTIASVSVKFTTFKSTAKNSANANINEIYNNVVGLLRILSNPEFLFPNISPIL